MITGASPWETYYSLWENSTWEMWLQSAIAIQEETLQYEADRGRTQCCGHYCQGQSIRPPCLKVTLNLSFWGLS